MGSISSSAERSTSRYRGQLTALFLALVSLLVVFAPAQLAFSDEEEVGLESNLRIVGIMVSFGEPIPGVQVTVTGPGFEGDAVTDEEGRWSLAVPSRANYEITIDVDTIPEGFALREGAATTLTVLEGDWLSSSITRNFQFEQQEVVTASFSDVLLQRLAAGVILGALLALASVGLSLIFGTTGISNFAHGEAVTLGAIVAWVSGTLFGLPFPVVLGIAVIVGVLSGWLQDVILWSPLRRKGLKLVQLMIVSIGLSIVLRYLYLMFIDGTTKQYDGGLGGVVELGPVRLTVGSLVTIAISLVILVLFGLALTRTRLGRATRAVSDNRPLAEASGIDSEYVIRYVWIVGSILATLAGVMLALYRQVSWLMGFEILLLLFAAVTLGGLGSAFGALVGAFIVGLLVELSAIVLPADLKYGTALLVLIVMLVFRPQGLLGRQERVG